MSKQEEIEKRAIELDKMVEKGKLVKAFEGTKMYKLLINWIAKECDVKKMLAAKKEDRDEGIGYLRFGEALKNQFEIWKKIGERKQKELIELLDEEDEHKE